MSPSSLFKICVQSLLVVCVFQVAFSNEYRDLSDAKVLRRRAPGTLTARIRSRRTTKYEYAVVIDAGSSGSRVRVYRWPDRIGGTRVETSGIEMMKPQLKLEPGLSRLVNDMGKVRDHIKQLITNASNHVPRRHHQVTPIYFMATAGMRQLNEEKMNDAVRFIDTLMRNGSFNPFSYKSSTNSRILSGEEEGVFAWITVNYLLGAFSDNGGKRDTAGILEMGGASTQIAFNPTGNVLADKFPVNIGRSRYPLYVHSYLDYGQDNLVRWIKNQIRNETLKKTPSMHVDTFNDPCMLAGDVQTLPGINGTFKGIGDPDKCVELLEILVYKVESWKCNPRPCAIGSFYQPTLPPNMTFYAVGAFTYSLSAIKALDPNGVYVPAYGLNKAYEYCRKPYAEVKALLGNSTKEDHFRYNCLRGLYTYVLFTRGYGFSNETDHIIVSDKINDQSLDWALGAVLYENVIQECRMHDVSTVPGNISGQSRNSIAAWTVTFFATILGIVLSTCTQLS